MGRPKKDIEERVVEDLASIQCSYAEIAMIVGCDPKTLSNRFSQAIKRGRGRFAASLKRKQYEVAMGCPAVYDEDGNVVEKERKPHPSMLMFLGKVHLGQVETSKLDIDARHEHSEASADARERLKSRIASIAESFGATGVLGEPESNGSGGA